MKNTLLLLLSIVSISIVTAQDSLKVKNDRSEQFRVGADMGISKRFGSLDNIPAELLFFYNDLKVGGYTQLSLDYGSANKINLGVVYNRFGASKFLPSVSFVDTLGNPSKGTLGEEVDITSIMLRVSGRSYVGNGKNIMLISSLGAGVSSYNQVSTRAESVVTLKGQSFILAASIGLDVFVFKNLALGTELKLFYGGLSNVEVNDGILVTEVALNESEKINLSKLEAGIGCRYYF